MIHRIKFLCLTALLILFFLSEKASAQFEGQIQFRAFEPDRIEKPHRGLEFTATGQRIHMTSDHHYRVFGGLDANTFLVRNDRNDFVFISGDSDALRISREDVDGLSNLIQRMQGSSSSGQQQFDWDRSLEQTGETKTILGFNTEQIKVYQQDSNNYISVWLTEEIKINWGILQDTWHQSMAAVVNMDLPIEVFMNRNSFPLMIEYYEDDRLATVVEATGINRERVDQTVVEIPQGVKMMGITDLMMRMMREQR